MSLRSRLRRLTLALGLAGALTGCAGGAGGEAGPAPAGALRVVTTVAPITSIVASIAGDRVSVTGIVPEGTDSHTFEPSPSTTAVLSAADVVFVNGLGLEEPTRKLAEETIGERAEIVEIGTEVLPKSQYLFDFSFPEEDGRPNPHLWTDPTWAVRYAEVVRDTLVERDASNASYYRSNFEAFAARAKELGAALRADQASVPGPLALLTYHDAYAYFARTFGWTVVGAVQPRNFEDPSPKEVAAIIDQVRAEDVPVIFGSEVFPSEVLEQISAETGVRYEATLRDDDLPGRPGDPEHSWFGLMRYDFVTMVTGLGGTAPALTALDVEGVAPDEATYPQ